MPSIRTRERGQRVQNSKQLGYIMLKTQDTRRIFLGCLRCYNEGKIIGEWVDLSDFSSLESLQEKAQEIVKDSPCIDGEEYDIQDSEGFNGLLNSYSPSLSLAWSIHETINHAENEGLDSEIFLEFVNYEGYGDLLREEDNYLVEKFQDAYRGSFDSMKEWAYEFVSDYLLSELSGKIKEQVEYFFDYEKYANDCESSGDIWHFRKNGQVHVFCNNY